MASEKIGGTQTAVIGTEHVLATVTDAGTYELKVDTRNMANGDELELRVYTAVRSAESRYLLYSQGYKNIQGDGAADAAGDGSVIKASPPIVVPFSVLFTLKQVAGTGRAFVWSVHNLA